MPDNNNLETSVKINPNLFIKESLTNQLPKSFLTEQLGVYLLLTEIAVFAGASALFSIDHPLPQVLAAYITLGFSLAPISIYSDVIKFPAIKSQYQELAYDTVALKKLTGILTDGTRGSMLGHTRAEDNKFEWRKRPYSLVGYKKAIINEAGKRMTQNTAEWLWQLAITTPDPELKLETIALISKKAKRFLSEKKDPTSELEVRMIAIINGDKKHTRELKYLEKREIFKTAVKISNLVMENFKDLSTTLIPYIKLYSLRRIMEHIRSNQIPKGTDIKFVQQLVDELQRDLSKKNIFQKESSHNPESVTIGLEIQPERRAWSTPLRVDYDDICRIRNYAGFKYSSDFPFEFVFSPTKSAEAQLLILKEVCLLTGIPIPQIGAQINFGGITKYEDVVTLQKIILQDGYLKPDDIGAMVNRGAYWSLTTPHKGIVNLRTPGDDDDKIESIVPRDEDHPEYAYVAEIRVPVVSANLPNFYKGLLRAKEFADMLKATEREGAGLSISQQERILCSKLKLTIEKCNQRLEKIGMPRIDIPWSNNDYKKLGKFLVHLV